jgi:glycosyltransferase involved in cell wall biosynthesis
LIALEGLPASRIEVVYNGVDAGRFEVADGKEIERRRVGLPLPVDRPIIVHVGTLRPVKDHGTAIRAFARVHAQQPEAVLAFVGGGPDLAKCQELVSRLGLADSTVFLGSRDDVPRVLAAADIMLMTSLSEGHSVALLEGMAAGLPVVATNVGGIPETVADGQTGLLAPVGDDAAVAAQLVRLLNDESLRQAMGRAGRERVRTLFTRQAMHRRYVEIYHGVVEGRARP